MTTINRMATITQSLTSEAIDTNLTGVGIEPENLSVININSEVGNEKNDTLNKKKRITNLSDDLKMQLYDLIIQLSKCIYKSLEQTDENTINNSIQFYSSGLTFYFIESYTPVFLLRFKDYNSVKAYILSLIDEFNSNSFDFKVFSNTINSLIFLSIITCNYNFLDILSDKFDFILENTRKLHYYYKSKGDKYTNYFDLIEFIYGTCFQKFFCRETLFDTINSLNEEDYEETIMDKRIIYFSKIYEKISFILIRKIVEEKIKFSNPLIVKTISILKKSIDEYNYFNEEILEMGNVKYFIHKFREIYLPNTCDLLIIQALMSGRSKYGKFSLISDNKIVKPYFMKLFCSRIKTSDFDISNLICEDVQKWILLDYIHDRNYTSMFIKNKIQ